MPVNAVPFFISPVGRDRHGYFRIVTAPRVFRRPKKIYSTTPAEATACTRRLLQAISDEPPPQASSAGIAAVLPAAGAAAAADGPLPIGDIVAVVLIVGAIAFAVTSSAESDEERAARCEAQFDEDNVQCRRLASPRRRAICYGNAVERLGACLVGRPLPPLIPPSYLQ